MAITPGTVAVTTTIEGTIDGNVFDLTDIFSQDNISYMDKRNLLIPSGSEIDVANFAGAGAAIGAGKFVASKTTYIFVKNKDATNYIRVRLYKTGADAVDLKVLAGRMIVLTDVSLSVSATAAAFAAFAVATGLAMQANGGDVDVEICIVQTT